jgi:hypothetical protein
MASPRLVSYDRSVLRVLFLLVLANVAAVAQSPLVRVLNTSRPASTDFKIGDRFGIEITGAPNQPVSVRTTRQGRTDWSPVIGSTDSIGRWSTAGQFEKSDFGGWTEVWTIGGKLASPAIHFWVNAPCLPGGNVLAAMSGPNVVLTCDTPENRQTFVTPFLPDPFRTPEGRLVNGRASEQTQEQYHTEILQHLITSGMGTARIALQSSRGSLGDETADLISKLIGANALYEDETRNLLAIIQAAFENPETIQRSATNPSSTLLLLRHLADFTDQDRLKREIADTMAYVQTR